MDDQNDLVPTGARVQLEKLAAQLQEEQAQASVVPQTGSDTPTIFGFTPGALFVSLIVSMLGVAYLRFARSTGEPIIAVLGLVLLVVPFFVTNVWWLVGIGAGVVVLTFLLRRFVRY